jgi:hypothetical protein
MIIGLSARVGNPGFDAISFVAQGFRKRDLRSVRFAKLQPFSGESCAAHPHRMHLRP